MGFNSTWMQDMYLPLAGWSINEVRVTHDDLNRAKFINENRIPDTWHEFEHGFVSDKTDGEIKHGVLVGSVYYDLGNQIQNIYQAISIFDCKDGFLSQPFVLKLDIKDTKVSYSREKILWQDSDTTLDAVTRAMKGLVDDIKDSVNKIKSYNLNADDYIRRLSALKLNVSTKTQPSAYKMLLLKTPNFDMSKPLEIENVRMEFYRNWSNTLRSSTTAVHDTIGLDKIQEYYIVVEDTMPFDNKMNSVRRVIQEIFRMESSISQTSKELHQICEYMNKEHNRYPEFCVIHESDFVKIPSIYRQQSDNLQSLRDAKNEANRNARATASTNSNSQPPRSQRVYTMLASQSSNPSLETLVRNLPTEQQQSTLLLPHDSKYAFKAMNVPTAPQLIAKLLPFKHILCAKNKVDFERMQKAQPDAITMSDDEISFAIAKHIHDRKWASEDTFCQQIFQTLCWALNADDDTVYYTPSFQPTYYMNIHSDNWKNIKYITQIIKNINDDIKNEPVLDEIQNLIDNMPENTHPHQVTDELRLLMSLCNAHQTYMHRKELNDLQDKVALQYAREIALMKSLYK